MDQRIRLLEQQIAARKQQIALADEEAKKFLELRIQGLRTPEIAQACDVTPSHVTNTILEYEKRYGLSPSHNITRATIADERAEKMRSLKVEGVSVNEIARMYGITPGAVSMAIAGYEKRQGLPSFKVSRFTKEGQSDIEKPVIVGTADERGEKMRSLKLKGLTLEEIGETHGITRERVRQLIARYEKKHGLPASIPTSRKARTNARKADIEEYKEEQRLEKQKQYKRFVPSFQLDAHLVGRFLKQLGNNTVLYGFDGKSRRNPKKRKDGIVYPSQNTPTNIFINYNDKHLTLHSWVLQQHGVKIEQNQHCHHIDGDVTNNMLENLQVLSNVDHGRLTWQEQMAEGTIDFENNPRYQRVLTDEQVEEIRSLYRPRVTPVHEMAKTYGVSTATLWDAIHGRGSYINVNPASCRVQKKSSAKQIEMDFGAKTP